jgi:AcrR family transcriptional regulator
MKTPASRRRTRQAEPLTRERIVGAALEEIEASSLAGFSTRKLGERLGVEAMSIYHHFPSKQHLLDALVAQAIESVEVPAPVERDDAENERRVRACLHSYRAMARRWPALFPLVAVHRLNMPAGVRFIEAVLRLMRSVIADDELAARHFRVMGYYLIGAGLEETAGYARGPSAAEPVGDDFVTRECPNLIAATPYFQQRHWDATFELGIDALIERAKADVAMRRKRRSARS